MQMIGILFLWCGTTAFCVGLALKQLELIIFPVLHDAGR